MQTLIFSKDRGAQLECLLASLWEYDKERIFEPIVLYTSSDDKFEEGYTKCIEKWYSQEYKNFVMFIRENNFREDLLRVSASPSFNSYYHPDYVMCLVDDMILRKEIDISWDEMQEMVDMPNMSCLSLRLGANTDWQYQTDSPIKMPQFSEKENCLYWNRLGCSPAQNFNYPLSTDGHIYKSKFLIPLIKQTQFKTPNQFEANLQQHTRKCPPFMSCPKDSLFFNNVINICQYEYENKYGEEISYSLEELNQRYLDGEVIDFKNMALDTIRGCHGEVELEWEND